MIFTSASRPRRGHKVEAIAGSERMLKAHHKNAVFLKNLEDIKNGLDGSCQKKLSKVQQEIYDVYFNEYIPLREQAIRTKTKFPTIFNGHSDEKWTKLATIPGTGGGNRVHLPEIHAFSLVSVGIKERGDNTKNASTGSVIDLLRQTEETRRESSKRKKPRVTKTPSSLWADDTDSEDGMHIDEDRLRILKAAIALTSQPAQSPEPRVPQRFRKSYLLNLRRESKIVWEKELLRKASGHSRTPRHSQQASTQQIPGRSSEQGAEDKTVFPWLPSLSRNKILNSSDDESDNEFEFSFPDRVQLRASITLNDGDVVANTSQTKSDAPMLDIETGLYMEESSPDIFSMVSEGSCSSFSGGSEYSTDSEG